jgi:hypothetical protein
VSFLGLPRGLLKGVEDDMRVEIWTRFWNSNQRLIEETHRKEETLGNYNVSLKEIKETFPDCCEAHIVIKFEV